MTHTMIENWIHDHNDSVPDDDFLSVCFLNVWMADQSISEEVLKTHN